MKAELCHGDVIWMHRVDANPIWVSNYDIEAGRVEGDRLDWVCQLLDDLEGERAWMSSVTPNHESLIRSCRRQDWLLHAGGHSRQFLSVERDGQIGNPAKVLRFLLLNAHFEYLAPCSCVDNEVTNLFHAGDREVWCDVLVFEILVPLDFILVDRHGHVILEKFKWIPHLSCRLVELKSARCIGNDEVILLERQYILNPKVVPRRISQHEFKFTVLVAEQDFSAVRADKQEVADPGMASVVQTVECCIFFGQSIRPLRPRSVVPQLVILVAVGAED